MVSIQRALFSLAGAIVALPLVPISRWLRRETVDEGLRFFNMAFFYALAIFGRPAITLLMQERPQGRYATHKPVCQSGIGVFNSLQEKDIILRLSKMGQKHSAHDGKDFAQQSDSRRPMGLCEQITRGKSAPMA